MKLFKINCPRTRITSKYNARKDVWIVRQHWLIFSQIIHVTRSPETCVAFKLNAMNRQALAI
jgi:hypothetical protein